jgi:hypothetical protein
MMDGVNRKQRITCSIQDMEFKDVLKVLGGLFGYRYLAIFSEETLKRKITLQLQNYTWEDALSALYLVVQDLEWSSFGEVVTIFESSLSEHFDQILQPVYFSWDPRAFDNFMNMGSIPDCLVAVCFRFRKNITLKTRDFHSMMESGIINLDGTDLQKEGFMPLFSGFEETICKDKNISSVDHPWYIC